MYLWKISIYERGDPLEAKCFVFRVEAIGMDDAIRKGRSKLPDGFKEVSVWAQRVD